MCKEIWVRNYECAVMDLAEEHDIEADEAEKMLDEILDKHPTYVDSYITWDM